MLFMCDVCDVDDGIDLYVVPCGRAYTCGTDEALADVQFDAI